MKILILLLLMFIYIIGGCYFENTIMIKSPAFYGFYGSCFGAVIMAIILGLKQQEKTKWIYSDTQKKVAPKL